MVKCLEYVCACQHSYHCWQRGYNGSHRWAGEVFSLFMIIVFGLAAFGKMGIYTKSLQ